jgi:hypothetical protein
VFATTFIADDAVAEVDGETEPEALEAEAAADEPATLDADGDEPADEGDEPGALIVGDVPAAVELPEATGADALEAAGVDAPGVEAEADRQAELELG